MTQGRKIARKETAIPRATFARLVKSISSKVKTGEKDLKWSEGGIDILQEETEQYLYKHFLRGNNLLQSFRQRTLDVKHFRSASEII